MERITNCVRCHEPIKVAGVVEPSPEIPEVPLEVECPVCGTSNTLLWPQNSQYIVVPAN